MERVITVSFQRAIHARLLPRMAKTVWYGHGHGNCDLKYVLLVLLTNISDSQVWQTFHSAKK